MHLGRVLATLATGLLGATLLAAPADAAAPGPEYPIGSYGVSDTGGYLSSYDGSPLVFKLFVHEDDVADDATPTQELVRVLDVGNGTTVPFDNSDYAPDAWYAEGRIAEPGTYHPSVRLTDGDGHTRTIPLPPITVLVDDVAPRVRAALPGTRQRHRAAAWRVPHGTAYDTGGSGLRVVQVHTLQQRHGRWYAYDFTSRRWVRGSRSLAATITATLATRATRTTTSRAVWDAPAVRGLTRGRIVVRAQAVDWGLNTATSVARGRITRR